MKMRTKEFLIIGVILLAVIVIFALALLSQRMPQNPPDTVGNTAGNLNNGGLFCENEGTVYFANAYDNGTLYRMNPDETGIEKISNAKVHSINAGGDYLYYYQEDSAASSSFASIFRVSGIYRVKKDGRKPLCLKRSPVPSLVLAGNTVFYQMNSTKAGTTFWRIGTNKEEDSQLADYVINPASVQNGLLYFSGMQKDHYLYALDIHTNNITTVWQGNLFNPIVQGDFVYYMDMSTDYQLCRYSLQEQTVQVLTTDRLDFFNVYGDMIYYQKSSSSEPALKRIRTDGSGEEVVAEGVYTNINITSAYVYFNAFSQDTPVYHTPTTGPVNVQPFTAAEQAANSAV